MDKGKLVFYGIIAFVILLTGIYTFSVFSKNEVANQTTDFTIPEMVEKDQAKDDYNSRLKNANTYQEPEVKKDVSESVRFNTYESKTKREVEKHETVNANVNRSLQKTVIVNSEPKKDIQEEQKTNEITTVKEEKKEVVKEDDSGFGIVMNESSRISRPNTNSVNSTPTVQASSTGFYAAVLEEDSQIKSGISVVFFLIEDCTFDGVTFKKNSILYGQSLLSGNVFDIHINQIKNYADGRVYSVYNVVVYDEKYKKGLATGGNLNESVKEGVNQTSTDEANSLTSNISSSTTVGIAAKTLNNTIRAFSSKKEPYINRNKGYKIFIKQE